MEKYEISLNEEMRHINVDGEPTNDFGLCAQVWQDLCKVESAGSLQAEDALIKDILQQILVSKFGDVKNIPMPNYYKNMGGEENE